MMLSPRARGWATIAILVMVAVLGSSAQQQAVRTLQPPAPTIRRSPISPNDALIAMGIAGYADRLSVQLRETVRFMVSSELPRYRAQIVGLIHGDPNANGPGIKEALIETPANGEYAGKRQELPLGPYVTVPDNPALRLTGSFTITAWIAPTRPGKVGWAGVPGAEGVVTKWSSSDESGYGLFIDEAGHLALWIGGRGRRVEKVSAEPALRAWVPVHFGGPFATEGGAHSGYFVAASYDAAAKQVVLYQQPLDRFPTAVWTDLDERFHLQLTKRLANQHPADAEMAGERASLGGASPQGCPADHDMAGATGRRDR